MKSSQVSAHAADVAAIEAARDPKPHRSGRSAKKHTIRERASTFANIVSWWARLAQPFASLENVRKLAINTLTIAAAILAALAMGNAVFERAYVIEPLQVPKQLEERGYSGTVVAQRILDEIHEINRLAQSTIQRSTFLRMSPEGTALKIEIPIGGISLSALVSAARQLLRINNTKITGEIVATEASRSQSSPAAATFSIRVRIADGKASEKTESQENTEDIDLLLRRAARGVVEHATPHVAASYYYGLYNAAQTPADRSVYLDNIERMIVASINTGDKEIIARAVTLRGATAHYGRKDLEQAIVQYKLVRMDTQAFPAARYNLAEVYRVQATQTRELNANERLKKLEEARRAVDEGIQRDDQKQSRATGYYMAAAVATDLARLSEGAKREGYYQNALRFLNLSIETNWERASAYAYRGVILDCVAQPRPDAANLDYERALETSKSVADYRQLASIYFGLGNIQQSIRTLERARQLFPSAERVNADLLRVKAASAETCQMPRIPT